MAKRMLLVLLLVLAGCGAVADAAVPKGAGWMAAPGGVTVPGSEHRYIAISPRALTVVAQVERRDGRLSRWWRLPGAFQVPAVANDGSAGGLSADGSTLVLSPDMLAYRPRGTRFAILYPQRSLRRRGQWRLAREPRPFRFVDLPGKFSFDAISPDGSTAYLIRYPHADGGEDYEVRALDTRSGNLLPRPIVDPEEPDEPMQGIPLSRASSPDGRWAYTLYDGLDHEPFIHALDTVGRTAVCIDLPQLERLDDRFFYLLHLGLEEEGRELVVLRHRLGPADAVPLLMVDTENFEVGKPASEATGAAIGLPWSPIGAVAVVLLLGIAWRTGRRRKDGAKAPEGA